ncbi:hypothetical protein ACWEO2_44255, partial [Nocardia sp. NPDC004278]
ERIRDFDDPGQFLEELGEDMGVAEATGGAFPSDRPGTAPDGVSRTTPGGADGTAAPGTTPIGAPHSPADAPVRRPELVLTPRQREILEQYVIDESYKEAGKRLGDTNKATVFQHVASAVRKLGAADVWQVVDWQRDADDRGVVVEQIAEEARRHSQRSVRAPTDIQRKALAQYFLDGGYNKAGRSLGIDPSSVKSSVEGAVRRLGAAHAGQAVGWQREAVRRGVGVEQVAREARQRPQTAQEPGAGVPSAPVRELTSKQGEALEQFAIDEDYTAAARRLDGINAATVHRHVAAAVVRLGAADVWQAVEWQCEAVGRGVGVEQIAREARQHPQTAQRSVGLRTVHQGEAFAQYVLDWRYSAAGRSLGMDPSAVRSAVAAMVRMLRAAHVGQAARWQREAVRRGVGVEQVAREARQRPQAVGEPGAEGGYTAGPSTLSAPAQASSSRDSGAARPWVPRASGADSAGDRNAPVADPSGPGDGAVSVRDDLHPGHD